MKKLKNSKGLMIHIADDMKQSEHVWKRSIGKQLVLVQIASNSFRYRLTKVDDQKNWLNIGKMITAKTCCYPDLM